MSRRRYGRAKVVAHGSDWLREERSSRHRCWSVHGIMINTQFVVGNEPILVNDLLGNDQG